MKSFPPFSFDFEDRTLWFGQQQVALTRKACAVLHCLLSAPGGWVSKATIMSTVWPDTHVQPDNVKVLIREIRQALGDEPRLAKYIRSAPGRGYSFVAPVTDGGRCRPAGATTGVRVPTFVNRGPELAALADALDAVRASSRRLVLVSGERGIGKTALCDAFVKTATATSPLRVGLGQCLDRESPAESYYPFLDVLLRLDRRHPDVVPQILSEQAPSWLALFPQWLGNRPAGVHPVRMLDELKAALDAISHDLPLVLVLEDLQWADSESVYALARLAASQMPAKLLIVATYSEGNWKAGERARQKLIRTASENDRCAQLTMGPLTVEHVGRYVDARFGPDCLSEIAGAVHRATGGNAFMMVSAIDSLVARRLVVRDATGWHREAPLESIAKALPETLGDAIARQVDQLDASERETLEAAAAVGLEFSAGAVATALDSTVEYARRMLGAIARRGELIVTVPNDATMRPIQGLYRFRHALHAEVIAQRAPMLRQLRAVERVGRARELKLRRA
jgi:predicted ATPase